MHKIDEVLDKMRRYIEKEQLYNRAGVDESYASKDSITESSLYEIDIEEIMDMFADLFTPKKVDDNNVDLRSRKKTSSLKPTKLYDNTVSQIFPDKSKNYFGVYLQKEMKKEEKQKSLIEFYEKYKSISLVKELNKSTFNHRSSISDSKFSTAIGLTKGGKGFNNSSYQTRELGLSRKSSVISNYNKSSIQQSFPKLKESLKPDSTLANDSIIGITNIMGTIEKRKMRNKIIDEGSRRSVIFDREKVEKMTDKRLKNLNSYRNSMKVYRLNRR